MPSAKESLCEAITGLHGRPLTVLLDYDGTLVPIAATPELARPDDELIGVLRALSMRPQTDVHVVSGRKRAPLEGWFGREALDLWAEHGLWHRAAGARQWRQLAPIPARALDRVRPIVDGVTAETPGARVETKSGSIAWHYRQVAPVLAAERLREMRALLENAIGDQPLELLDGRKVLEIRARGVNKAIVAAHLAATDRTVLAIGDDRTDEELFAALPASSLTVAVGCGTTQAKYRVDDPNAVRGLLRTLAAL